MSAFKYEFTQINMRHSKDPTGLVRRSMEGSITKQHIYLIQEPWIWRSRVRGLGVVGYDLFYNRNGTRPRTAIACNSLVNGFMLNTLTTDDLTAIQIKSSVQGEVMDIVVASCYLPYETEVVTPSLARLIDYCKNKHLQLLIGCDANAHNENWGSTDNNTRGINLLEYIAGTNLDILNRGNRPTFVSDIDGRQEVIDITICSNRLTQAIQNWRVADELTMSDHMYIKYELNPSASDIPQIPRRNPRKTNWDKYRADLELRTRKGKRIVNTGTLEEGAKLLETSLIKAFEDNCKPGVPKNKSPPWWSKDLDKRRKITRKALRRALQTNLDADWTDYRNLQRDLKYQIRINKKTAWEKFCENTDGLSEISKLKKILTSADMGKIGTLKNPDGTLSQTPEESLKILMDSHFPENKAVEDANAQPQEQISPSREDWKIAGQVVTYSKLNRALNLFDSYKSPGPDNIYPALLKESPKRVKRNLRDVLRASLAFGYIPISWRQVRVVFIPKPGKKDYTEAKSFRPISLTSFILKVLERLIETFIKETALLSKPLHLRQHAYLKGRSTETALYDLTSEADKGLRNREFTLVGLMDVQGAFDNARHDKIRESAEEKGIERTVVTWISNMLRHRTIQSKLGATECKVIATRGCPQGGVLSPLLWNLTIDSLLHRLDEHGHFAQAYADDVALVYRGRHMSTLCERMQQGLEITLDWCAEQQLSVNPQKTELILFTRRRRLGAYQLPVMNGVELKLSTEVKYLGVILDNKLTYGRHVEEQCNKAKRIMWALRGAFGRTWGLQPKQTLWLYTSIVRPILLYASIIWWRRALTTVGNNQLRGVQRLALMGATGAMRTTSTNALEALCALTPLDVTVRVTAKKAALRMKQNGTWRPTQGEDRRISLESLYSDIPELHMPQDTIKQISNNRNYDVIFPKRTEWKQDGLKGTTADTIVIYTDGSVTPDGTGAGVYIPGTGQKETYPLGKLATIFQAEMYAILKAAEELNRTLIRNRKIRFYSDSQASLLALQSQLIDSGLVAESADQLKRLARNNTVELCWVPGHSDILGNEIADELAKEGARGTPLGPEPRLPIGKSLITRKLKEAGEAEHCIRWRRAEDSRFAKHILAEPNKRNAKELLSLNRSRLSVATEVLTGHGRFHKHLVRLGVTSDGMCHMCLEDEETAEHFLTRCPALAICRYEIFGDPFPDLTNATWATPSNILRYIARTKRFKEE